MAGTLVQRSHHVSYGAGGEEGPQRGAGTGRAEDAEGVGGGSHREKGQRLAVRGAGLINLWATSSR